MAGLETVVILIVVAIGLVVIIFALSSDRSEKPAAPSIRNGEPVARTQGPKRKEAHQDAKVHRVIDGDTVIVSSHCGKTTIRLSAIDCPEDGQQWGDIAKYGLIKLIGGRRVRFEAHGRDNYGRTIATVYVQREDDWMNVNARLVTLGHAWVMRRHYDHLPRERQEELNRLERWAKSKKVGLWKHDNPVPPWKWRAGKAE